MNPEIAKKLKEAGFPQIGDNQDGYANDGGYEPSLSELIEACGKDFRLQNSNPDLWQADTCGDFNQFDKIIHKVGIGSTAKEAVARLYLKLNKK